MMVPLLTTGWTDITKKHISTITLIMIFCCFLIRVGKRISTKRARNLPDERNDDAWRRHMFTTRLWYDDRERLDLTDMYKYKEGRLKQVGTIYINYKRSTCNEISLWYHYKYSFFFFSSQQAARKSAPQS